MFDLTVTYDEGDPDTVTAGQREMAAWELAGYGSSLDAAEQKPMAFFRFLAYTALRRQGRVPMGAGKPPRPLKFEDWSDTVDTVEPVDEEAADPTRRDQPPAD